MLPRRPPSTCWTASRIDFIGGMQGGMVDACSAPFDMDHLLPLHRSHAHSSNDLTDAVSVISAYRSALSYPRSMSRKYSVSNCRWRVVDKDCDVLSFSGTPK